MALFVVTCTDKPGALEVRLANRPAHLDYVRALGPKIRAAGPFLDGEDKPAGSILICDVADRAALDALLAADPYAQAGLFASVDVKPFRWVIGAPADLQ
jgi:uncharacterized protein